ncbi:hypothetical protein E2C01_011125 [Portunus trituberculatus]|uniref:Serine-threonine/tyrosine-protein kinase catalytic domain-containing protein n=1 Tax=Portunus trituberculatus TaxID=210409 RepID=A0A5B7DAW6_PORTR|nr:hypothetical protein [Portunus trituberculatus]
MPRELNGMANRLNVKRNAEKLVETCQNREASFVRERYLFKVEESQCGYGSEEYSVLRDEGGAVHSARLCIDPYHPEHPGLRYSHSPSKKAVMIYLAVQFTYRSIVSARKLQEKGGSEVGVGLLRESSTEYDTFLLDVVSTLSFVPHLLQFHLQDSRDYYSSLGGMIRDLIKRSDSPLKLTRVLPFSDYDDTEQLLICASSSREVRCQDHSGPRVISMSHLTSIEDNITRGRYSDLIRAQWSGDKGREVAVKVPKLHSIEDTERYLAVVNQFAFVTCDCVVAVQGITLSPLALVMEYLPLGPLDKYLQEHHTSLKEVK